MKDGKVPKGVTVTITFKRPIMIRGYGVVCANDYADRDPHHWTLWGANHLKQTDNKPKFSLLHTVRNAKFEKRIDKQDFNLGPTLVSALMFEVFENKGSPDMQLKQFKIYC